MEMKASALIIGMIAGTDVHEIMGALFVVATVGMIEAAFSISKQRTALRTMILASIVGAIASSTFWLSTILFGIAALLGRNTTSANHHDN